MPIRSRVCSISSALDCKVAFELGWIGDFDMELLMLSGIDITE